MRRINDDTVYTVMLTSLLAEQWIKEITPLRSFVQTQVHQQPVYRAVIQTESTTNIMQSSDDGSHSQVFMGIKGHEMADRSAEEATKSEYTDVVCFRKTEIRSVIKESMKERWRKHQEEERKGRNRRDETMKT